MMKTIDVLIIEDDKFVARTIDRGLRNDQFTVTVASNGMDGLHLARQKRPDLIILDIIMRGMDGYAVCRAMRADPTLADVPILFLTAKIRAEDRLAGFQAGGDDYLCKPFNIDELYLRIQAILRRTLDPTRQIMINQLEPGKNTLVPGFASPGDSTTKEIRQDIAQVDERAYRAVDITAENRLVVGEFSLDTRTFELNTPARGKVRLTPLQYDLLYLLMSHPGEVFTPARLLNEIWDYPFGRGSLDLVRVHIKTLRERIEADPHTPVFLRTIPGSGYTVTANAG